MSPCAKSFREENTGDGEEAAVSVSSTLMSAYVVILTAGQPLLTVSLRTRSQAHKATGRYSALQVRT